VDRLDVFLYRTENVAEGFFVMYTASSTYLKAKMDVQDKPVTPTYM
jgi:hypothetical protein